MSQGFSLPERDVRKLEDDDGRVWDVVAGRESWGALYAIFAERGGHGEVRQVVLDARSWSEANQELGELERDGLIELLARSEPKEMG